MASEKSHCKDIENMGSKTGSTCSQSPRGQEVGNGDHIRKAKSHCVSLASSSLVRVISIKIMSLRSISFILITQVSKFHILILNSRILICLLFWNMHIFPKILYPFHPFFAFIPANPFKFNYFLILDKSVGMVD